MLLRRTALSAESNYAADSAVFLFAYFSEKMGIYLPAIFNTGFFIYNKGTLKIQETLYK